MIKIEKIFLILGTLYLIIGPCFAQQLPYYTQYKPNSIMLNPGVAGTKRIVDARMNYRKQWTGFSDAPTTLGFSANGRIVNGMMGIGLAYYNDKTGPTSRSDFSLIYSFHAHFDDVELSAGAAWHRLTYVVDGRMLHMHVPMDNAIDLFLLQN